MAHRVGSFLRSLLTFSALALAGCGDSEPASGLTAPPEFVPQARTLETDSSPLFVRFAELVPGLPTLVASDRSGNALQLLDAQSGDWQVRQRISLPESPGETAFVDLQGDGVAEIVVAYRSGSQIAILGRTSAGSWAVQQLLEVGSAPQGLRVADFDQDGYADLAVSNVGSDNLSVLFGQPGGTFSSPLTLAAGVSPVQLDSGDFNSDGRPDLAASNFGSNTVTLWFSLPSRGFAPGPTLPTGLQPFGLESVDLDADGRPELVVANEGAGTLTRYTFNEGVPDAGVSTPVGGKPDLVRAYDVEQDGRLELLVTLEDESGLAVVRNLDGQLTRSALIPTNGGPVGLDVRQELAVTANFFGSGLTLIQFRPTLPPVAWPMPPKPAQADPNPLRNTTISTPVTDT